MPDVLTLAEEALDVIPALARKWVDSAVEARAELATNEDWEASQANREAFKSRCATTLTAIRATRAEWGWRELSNVKEDHLKIGDWIGWFNADGWRVRVIKYATGVEAMVGAGHTHFYRPQLPPPPAREEVGNG